MKKTLLIMATIIVCGQPALAQLFKINTQEPWASKFGHSGIMPYDKIEHFARDFMIESVIYAAFPQRGVKFSVYGAFAFNIAYEIHDGIKWRETGGFGTRDFIAGSAGILASVGWRKLPQSLKLVSIPLVTFAFLSIRERGR